MMQRRGRQDDDWIPEARRMHRLGVGLGEIGRLFNVSRFRVQCAVKPEFREQQRENVRYARRNKTRRK